MKRVLMISALALSLVSIGFLQGVLAKAHESKERQVQSSTTLQAQNKPKSPVDIDGKPIGDAEAYAARRTMSDGRVIAYRKNKREIKALVNALKEDGKTDQKLLADRKLLDPQTWLQGPCSGSGINISCFGPCISPPAGTKCSVIVQNADPRRTSNPNPAWVSWWIRWEWCACV